MKLHIYHIEGGHGGISCLPGASALGTEYGKPIIINVRSVKDAERILQAMAQLATQGAKVLACLDLDHPAGLCDYYFVTDEYVRKECSLRGVHYEGL